MVGATNLGFLAKLAKERLWLELLLSVLKRGDYVLRSVNLITSLPYVNLTLISS